MGSKTADAPAHDNNTQGLPLMVKLNKIYTRTGDGGETSLVNGRRVAKHSRRPAAFGEVDEANSVIGLARLHCEGDADEMLGRIQNDLFDLGADLATPESDSPALRITDDQVARLETEIDRLNADLQPLTSFILPGGSPASAWLIWRALLPAAPSAR